MEEKRTREGGTGELIERLPRALIHEILSKLDLDSLCSSAPVCRSLRFSVSQVLCTIPALDLTGFPPTTTMLRALLNDNKVLRSLSLDCLRLDETACQYFAKEHLQELVLLKYFIFSSQVFSVLEEKCPRLRVLTMEAACLYETKSLNTCSISIFQMLNGLSCLEAVCIKLRSQRSFQLISSEPSVLTLPESVKSLILDTISEKDAVEILRRKIVSDHLLDHLKPDARLSSPPCIRSMRSLTLVLNTITDVLINLIVVNNPFLLELCLEDRPSGDPPLGGDLTSTGVRLLGRCAEMRSLSLSRSRQYADTSFRKVNDLDILLLAEQCRKLESVRLGGFSKVTDAGYISILHSCSELRKFEVVNAALLSDLAFQDVATASEALVEVRLISCNLLTSDTADALSFCSGLEVLDLSGCKSIADPGLCSISRLQMLTSLDLGGADITDSGLAALQHGLSPIAALCLRGCKRVTDKGLCLLFREESVISRTLSKLDMGYMPGVSDKAIASVAKFCRKVTDLSIRQCFFITDASIAALGSVGGSRSGTGDFLRRLDLFNCPGLSSAGLAKLLARPNFHGLRWIGIGFTNMLKGGGHGVAELSRDRPTLAICVDGCEMGCWDRWQIHERHCNLPVEC